MFSTVGFKRSVHFGCSQCGTYTFSVHWVRENSIYSNKTGVPTLIHLHFYMLVPPNSTDLYDSHVVRRMRLPYLFSSLYSILQSPYRSLFLLVLFTRIYTYDNKIVGKYFTVSTRALSYSTECFLSRIRKIKTSPNILIAL